jgi:hypothetical protein
MGLLKKGIGVIDKILPFKKGGSVKKGRRVARKRGGRVTKRSVKR